MRIILIISLSLLTFNSYCQSNSEQFKKQVLENEYLDKVDIISEIIGLNLSSLFTSTENSSVFGFIGDNYQRIRIKLISVIKNQHNPSQYFVYGKSMVKGNICEFQGTIEIKNVYSFKSSEFPNIRQGTIIGEYVFFENPSQKHVGQFKGVFSSDWYIDPKDGQIKYNDLMMDADGFSNNQFVGTWSSYQGTLTKTCNWGDYRIPMSGDLDSGAGEFHPDKKYLNNGWLTMKQAYGGPNDKTAEEARKEEKFEWWR